ncbi:MAG: T9SS type A sorting domain-containing protein [Bacteroidales bacterium]|nr:T9SS type A sorting domain-containing protein [Bacteroidales bacterium]
MKKTILILLACCIMPLCNATIITVTSTNDSGAGSLRQALADAANGDTINFSVTGVITVLSQLDIAKSITIQGPGADSLAIDGGGTSRIFYDGNSSLNTVEISGLELKNGFALNFGAAISGNSIDLKVKHCNIHSNTLTLSYGAGIRVSGLGSKLSIENTAIHHNTCPGSGGGIYLDNISELHITNSTIYGNSSANDGQAIELMSMPDPGNLTITMTNSTFAGHNTDAVALSIFALDYDTLYMNIRNCLFDNKDNLYINEALVNYITSANNISSDGSMGSIFSGPGNFQNTDCLLDTLAENGGPTPTVALLCNSPAINSGSSMFPYDQRGYPRVGIPDIGAYESSKYPTSGTIDIEVCNSYTSPSGLYTWTQSNTYSDTIPNATGCDSIITVHLTILEPTYDTIYDTACFSYTSPSEKYTWTTSSTYVDTIPNMAGCDSIITIHLKINKVNVTVTEASGTLTAYATDAACQWLDCSTMVPVADETGQSFTPVTNGSYAVQITQKGCMDTSRCYDMEIVGFMQESIFPGITCYPVPAKESVTIDLGKKYEEVTIKLFDITGQLISVNHYNYAEKTILCLPENSGIYMAEVFANNRFIATLKVIKP